MLPTAMFTLTFLGHQGWLVSTDRTHVLIDPLLGPGFGHGGLLGKVYPPRRFDFDAFPAIDALILTHEHDDHFDLPSLARIDRRVPVYLSRHSSRAAHEVLAEMGFRVAPLAPASTIEIGDLRYHSFVTDHRDGRQADEWDALPFLIHDCAGEGSLFSSVDVRPRPEDLAAVAQLCPQPGLWAYANNCSHAGFQTLHTRPAATTPTTDDDSPALAKLVLARHDELARHGGAPLRSLICGAGWTLDGDRSGLNHHLFPADIDSLVAALERQRPGFDALALRPGHALQLRAGVVCELLARRPFLATAPRASWPARDYRGPGSSLADYSPACGQRELSQAQRETLATELDDLARYLYAGPLFAALHSLPPTLASGHPSRLCLALRTETETLVFRYDPSRSAFVPTPSEDPVAAFGSGLECWASDLWALLRGEIGPSALCYAGRLRVWNHAPTQLRVSPALLWHYANPLRRPERAAALYRRLLADQGSAPIRVHASLGSNC